MHNVLFVVSALAGAGGYALLRWSARRESPRPPAPAAEPPPPPAAERSRLPKPLRVTVVVDRLDRGPVPATTTITLPEAYPAALGEDHRPKTTTTYLVEAVEVELNDFFDSFTSTSQRGVPDLRHCDVVVRGDGNHVGGNARHVITRVAMPLALLMKDNPALVDTCARALVDPAHREVFGERVAEVMREGAALGWLERHELALAQPLPAKEEPPAGPPDQRRWPFVFEPLPAEGEAAEGEARPAGGAPLPVEGEARPAVGEARPVEGEGLLAEGEPPPVERAARPAEGEPQPVEGASRLAAGEMRPAGGEPRLVEGGVRPVEGASRLAEGESPPVEGEAGPAEGEPAPAEGDVRPAADEVLRAEGEQAVVKAGRREGLPGGR